MVFTVIFPKSVVLENQRLALFYYALALGALVIIVRSFLLSKAYLVTQAPDGRVSFWAEGWNSNDAAQLSNEADELRPFCSAPSMYEYCYDSSCSWHYRNFKCTNLCTENDAESCMDGNERWFKDASTIYFPTYFNETIRLRNSGNETEPTINNQVFVKGVEDLSIGFDHRFVVEADPENSQRGNSKQGESEFYQEGMLTILIDAEGEEVQRWAAGESISIKVGKLLELTGISLDDVNTNGGINFVEGAALPDGPLQRITGAELSVEMSYYNPLQHSLQYDGPVCYVQIYGSRQWTSRPVGDMIDRLGSARYRYYYGLRVRFTAKGSFAWMEPAQIISCVTSVLVFIGVAKNVTFVVALYFLGHLSCIYKRFARERVNIPQECRGQAMRMTSYSQAYKQMENEGISPHQLFTRFRELFKFQEAISDEEIKNMVTIVFREFDKDGMGTIDLQEYTEACLSSEPMSFELTVGVFDVDRRLGNLEKLFIDDGLHKLHDEEKVLSFEPNQVFDTPNGSSHTEADKAKLVPSADLVGIPSEDMAVREVSPEDVRMSSMAGRLSPEGLVCLQMDVDKLRQSFKSLPQFHADLEMARTDIFSLRSEVEKAKQNYNFKKDFLSDVIDGTFNDLSQKLDKMHVEEQRFVKSISLHVLQRIAEKKRWIAGADCAPQEDSSLFPAMNCLLSPNCTRYPEDQRQNKMVRHRQE